MHFSDEKEKYDPSSFRDQIVAGLNDVNADLEQVRLSFIKFFILLSMLN